MLLYKYVSYDAGQKILAGSDIGFSQPRYFNDPFELAAGFPRTPTSDPLRDMLTGMRHWAKTSISLKNYAILTLTRSPLNPLMWAHYAQGHTGFVLGLDVGLSGLADEDTNLVPAQYGNIIYCDQRPTHPYLARIVPMEIGGEFSYRPDLLEKLQRLFLYKPICWSYEEEVRVVKCIKGIEHDQRLPSGQFRTIEVQGRPLHTVSLDPSSIGEIYLGVRNSILESDSARVEFLSRQQELHPGVRAWECNLGQTSWELTRSEL